MNTVMRLSGQLLSLCSAVLFLSGCGSNEIEPKIECATSDLVATTEANDANCGSATASIQIMATGGVAPYTYQLDDGTPQSSSTINNVAPGLYHITITDDNGCQFVANQAVKSTTSYDADIAPIIMASCSVTGCHDGSTSLPDFRLLSVVQANASQIKSFTQSGFMPQDGSIPQSQIDLIACWVDDGALDN